jgi:hypothetical protein
LTFSKNVRQNVDVLPHLHVCGVSYFDRFEFPLKFLCYHKIKSRNAAAEKLCLFLDTQHHFGRETPPPLPANFNVRL